MKKTALILTFLVCFICYQGFAGGKKETPVNEPVKPATELESITVTNINVTGNVTIAGDVTGIGNQQAAPGANPGQTPTPTPGVTPSPAPATDLQSETNQETEPTIKLPINRQRIFVNADLITLLQGNRMAFHDLRYFLSKDLKLKIAENDKDPVPKITDSGMLEIVIDPSFMDEIDISVDDEGKLVRLNDSEFEVLFKVMEKDITLIFTLNEQKFFELSSVEMLDNHKYTFIYNEGPPQLMVFGRDDRRNEVSVNLPLVNQGRREDSAAPRDIQTDNAVTLEQNGKNDAAEKENQDNNFIPPNNAQDIADEEDVSSAENIADNDKKDTNNQSDENENAVTVPAEDNQQNAGIVSPADNQNPETPPVNNQNAASVINEGDLNTSTPSVAENRNINTLPPASNQNTNVLLTAPRESSNQQVSRINNNITGRNTNIIGSRSLNEEGIIRYVRFRNNAPVLNDREIRELINIYFNEAAFENVNSDIAIAQMLYTTDFLRNRTILRVTYNYAGLERSGARWNGRPWNGRFPSDRIGIRAHIQHLRHYSAGTLVRSGGNVNPRWTILNQNRYLGTIRTFDQLFNRWAPNNSANYRARINDILRDLYNYSGRFS